jgi:hypothetical protein
MGFLSGSLVFLSPSIFPKVAALGRLLWSRTAFKPGAVRNSPGRWLAVSVIAAGWLVSALPAHAGQRIPQRHVQSITKRFVPIKRLESSTRLDLAIGLPLRNRDKLTNLLQELYRPSSPNFRHFLTPEQFAASFGPSEKDYQAVINFAKSRGLIVKRTHSNRTLLDVSGSVADIEKAFHLHMHVYQHPVEKRTFFAPDTDPSVDLDTPILAISGLDSYVRPHPLIHVQPSVHPLGGGSGGGGGGGGCSGTGTGSGFWGYYGYDFLEAYTPETLLDGTGQSVGLFELCGYSAEDIATYVDETGVPGVPLENVLIDGFDGNDSNESFAIECTADIEMAIAMAPNLSKVYVYEGPTPQNEPPAIQNPSTTAQINDVFNRMATDNLAKQLSCSYAMDINLSTVQIFQQFAAQGQSLFQASGDSGAFPAAVDEPADDPYITVVGGTTLYTDTNSLWCSETVWLTPANDPLLANPTELASGGGVSLAYKIPVWQQGINMTTNQGSTTMRNLPDVASVADGVDIVYGNDDPNVGFSIDYPVVGTSVAAPLWAAFTALVNQQAAANGQPPVGFINPALYAIGKSTNYTACFHDITTGNNFSPRSPTKYSAVAGYDLCTGWGTPNDPLIDALLAPPTESLVINPPDGFTSSGPGGGPFSVTSQTYTLTNSGSQPLNWSLANSANWFTVSSTSGTLAPGATTTVTVSLNSTANNFLITNASGNVTFTDLTDGMSQSRQFDLYVGNGGFEAGDFTYWKLVGDTNSTIVLAADDVDVAGTNALPGEPDELFVHSGLYGGYLGQLPPDASLSQTIATTAGQQYAVSFWLTSVPEQGSTTPNHFAAKWDGSTLYANTNLPAFGWTNLQFTVPASTANTTLEFDFNDQPGAFGLDDITVEPVSARIFQSIVLAPGTNVLISWPISAAAFQLQSSSNLLGSWVNVATPLTTNGNQISTLVPLQGSQQFFRLKQ